MKTLVFLVIRVERARTAKGWSQGCFCRPARSRGDGWMSRGAWSWLSGMRDVDGAPIG
jgi:hypothetical protein